MNLEHFKLYTTDDFIFDDDFRKIVQESGHSDRLKVLLENLPEKRNEINIAVHVLRGLHVERFHQPYQRKKDLWHQILQAQKKQVRFMYFRYAASLLLLIGVGSAVLYIAAKKNVDKVIVANNPPSDNATLILADGKEVSISSKQSTVHFSSDGSGIVVNDTSGVAQAVSNDGLNQMIVPYGKRSFVLLSEGTKVWLNSGSKLVFPSVFKGKTREVYLEGEALFDVTKNNEKPFYVKTDVFKMKVYGTKFNVQAYLQDNAYSIVLVEGKVSMNINNSVQLTEVFLAPNQKASLTKGQGNFEINNVENTEIYTAWIEGYLTFVNEEVPDLLKRVSRYYNVTIETELPDNVEKIYGKLDLKDDLERVLDGIAFISKTKYKKEGNKYVFMAN
ncbi:MAG: FecR family protein [Bacteroidia bacterium]|nr:FecR family protein [Bacteroidia bacterium]